MDAEEFHYTSKEAAEYLDISVDKVRHLTRIGVMKAAEGGGGGGGRYYYFTQEELDEIDELLEPYR